MKTNKKVIVDTDLIRILLDAQNLLVYIRLSEGGFIEHEPFRNTPEGLVGALMLAADVNAGKFYPKRVVLSEDEVMEKLGMKQLKGPTKLLGNGGES